MIHSRLIDEKRAEWADLIVVMDPKQARELLSQLGGPRERLLVFGDLDPGSPDRREIPNPVGRKEECLMETYQRIGLCLAEAFPLIQAEP